MYHQCWWLGRQAGAGCPAICCWQILGVPRLRLDEVSLATSDRSDVVSVIIVKWTWCKFCKCLSLKKGIWHCLSILLQWVSKSLTFRGNLSLLRGHLDWWTSNYFSCSFNLVIITIFFSLWFSFSIVVAAFSLCSYYMCSLTIHMFSICSCFSRSMYLFILFNLEWENMAAEFSINDRWAQCSCIKWTCFNRWSLLVINSC